MISKLSHIAAASLLALGVASSMSVQAQALNQPNAQPLNQASVPAKVTVAQAKELPDDSQVILEGILVKKLGHENYEFKDDSGTISVEIDDDDWHGQLVNAGQKVRLVGEVDTHRIKPTDIDVKKVEVLK